MSSCPARTSAVFPGTQSTAPRTWHWPSGWRRRRVGQAIDIGDGASPHARPPAISVRRSAARPAANGAGADADARGGWPPGSTRSARRQFAISSSTPLDPLELGGAMRKGSWPGFYVIGQAQVGAEIEEFVRDTGSMTSSRRMPRRHVQPGDAETAWSRPPCHSVNAQMRPWKPLTGAKCVSRHRGAGVDAVRTTMAHSKRDKFRRVTDSPPPVGGIKGGVAPLKAVSRKFNAAPPTRRPTPPPGEGGKR